MPNISKMEKILPYVPCFGIGTQKNGWNLLLSVNNFVCRFHNIWFLHKQFFGSDVCVPIFW